MSQLVPDPLATLVHAHIDELRREAAADGLARAARPRRTSARWSWPGSVATALRETFSRDPVSAPSPRRGQPCPTC